MTPPLLIATPGDDSLRVSSALGADLLELPDAAGIDGWDETTVLEQWRDARGTGRIHDRVVVMVQPTPPSRADAVTLDVSDWVGRAEMPLALWVAALGVAVRRVADGGSIVAVVDQPGPLDSPGLAAEAAVADGVEALVRSLAKSEGPTRGVRVNLVTTPRRLVAAPVSPAPPLDGFPGTLDHVISATRTLLAGEDSVVTGSVVRADAGRDYR